MKTNIFLVLLLCFSTSLFAQDERLENDPITYYFTPDTIQLPLLSMENKEFENLLQSVVLEYIEKNNIDKTDTRDHAFLLHETQGDQSVTIHLSYHLAYECIQFVRGGYFRFRGHNFYVSSDLANSLFPRAGITANHQYNRPDCIDNATEEVLHNCYPMENNYTPIWIFSNTNGKIEMIRQ